MEHLRNHERRRFDRVFSQRLNDASLSPDRRPARRPSALKSSSSNGQWIPRPAPQGRHMFRSLAVPRRSRGYQANGSETERPSSKATIRLASVTRTFSTCTVLLGAKAVIPFPSEFDVVTFHQFLQPGKLGPRETAGAVQSDGAQPKLRRRGLALDMHVHRLIAITRVKVKAIG